MTSAPGEGLFSAGLWGTAGPDEMISPAPAVVDQAGDLPTVLFSGAAGRAAWSARGGLRRHAVSPRPFRGRYVRAVPAAGSLRDPAWDATIRATAPYQPERRRPGGPAVTIHAHELLRKERLHRPGRLLLLVTDISGSMGGEMMALAKRTALTLLEQAYVKRDRIAMVAFRDRTAELLFPPTNQARLVHRALADLPCGGTTPLAMGLELSHGILRRAITRDPDLKPLMLLISDGRANVGSLPGLEAIRAEVESWSQALAGQRGLEVLFLDTTEEGKEDFAARWLSSQMGARRFLLWQILRSGRDPAVEIMKAVG